MTNQKKLHQEFFEGLGYRCVNQKIDYSGPDLYAIPGEQGYDEQICVENLPSPYSPEHIEAYKRFVDRKVAEKMGWTYQSVLYSANLRIGEDRPSHVWVDPGKKKHKKLPRFTKIMRDFKMAIEWMRGKGYTPAIERGHARWHYNTASKKSPTVKIHSNEIFLGWCEGMLGVEA